MAVAPDSLPGVPQPPAKDRRDVSPTAWNRAPRTPTFKAAGATGGRAPVGPEESPDDGSTPRRLHRLLFPAPPLRFLLPSPASVLKGRCPGRGDGRWRLWIAARVLLGPAWSGWTAVRALCFGLGTAWLLRRRVLPATQAACRVQSGA